MEITQCLKPRESWREIDKNMYNLYGLENNIQAKVAVAFALSKSMEPEKTLTIYDYGKQKSLYGDLDAEYKELQLDISKQEEYGAFPEHWEKGNNIFYSVLRLVKSPSVRMVDIFFDCDGKTYCAHTYIDKNIKDLTLKSVAKNNADIGYLLNEIEHIKA